MIVIPAIDLRGGKCVRLLHGDFSRETVYGDDPVAMAHHWAGAGAAILHVVDLDGAAAGCPRQTELIAAICAAIPIPVEVGGGLRTLADIDATLAAGVSRVVLGTAAIETPDLVTAALMAHGPERIVLGLDARDGYVATGGWLETSNVRAVDLARAMAACGVRHVVATDIARDGARTGPNVAFLAEIATSGLAVIASGGVKDRSHLTLLAAISGVEAVITGTALYTGDLILGPGEWEIPAPR
ncbi:MAG: 1-(5-phosphoribosyl)-5-[(5-phosphoribosylamino)methylideneamino]imidazole-4-carboxamide isomerase [Chloroflexota bacterium]|nr:1-(5-phosphoribosyl)-5-[(5-phosphoribosylamino)methylideneamino]imidazole-4-carboxamide isomerase [Chloroflexota bacterium]